MATLVIVLGFALAILAAYGVLRALGYEDDWDDAHDLPRRPDVPPASAPIRAAAREGASAVQGGFPLHAEWTIDGQT